MCLHLLFTHAAATTLTALLTCHICVWGTVLRIDVKVLDTIIRCLQNHWDKHKDTRPPLDPHLVSFLVTQAYNIMKAGGPEALNDDASCVLNPLPPSLITMVYRPDSPSPA